MARTALDAGKVANELNAILRLGVYASEYGYHDIDIPAYVHEDGRISATLHVDCPPQDYLRAYGKQDELDAMAIRNDAYYDVNITSGNVYSDDDELVRLIVTVRGNLR